MNTFAPLLIDAAAVHEHVDVATCHALIRDAMMALSAGCSPFIPRAGVPMGEDRIFGVMPGRLAAHGGEQSVFGAKLLGIFPDPAMPSRHRHNGVVVLFDGNTGMPLAVADADEVTTLRTAAASAVATQALARPDSRCLGILGTGTQAKSHLKALTSCHRYEDIVIWGIEEGAAHVFATEMSSLLAQPVRYLSSPKHVAEVADVICTVTPAREPILLGDWVRPGTHINAVGSSMPGPAEIDTDLVVHSRYVVDSRASALAQAAEFIYAKQSGRVDESHIVGEIGQVLAGEVPGRRHSDEVTVYKSLGHIAQDLAVVRHLHQRMLAASVRAK